MDNLIFLKLGGSLITDKQSPETVREAVLRRVAQEIKQAYEANPNLNLVLGHGSGSFGHITAAHYKTRDGVETKAEWHGFAEVSQKALTLNRRVCDALLEAGVPVLSVPPSATAVCTDGHITALSSQTVENALLNGLVPVIFGDVAFDTVRGGTIMSTEEVMTHLITHSPLNPAWLLLAGETEGVYDEAKQTISAIHPRNFEQIAPALGGSRGTDVTGGMKSKVQAMLDLVTTYETMQIRIFSGLETGNVQALLTEPAQGLGTVIQP